MRQMTEEVVREEMSRGLKEMTKTAGRYITFIEVRLGHVILHRRKRSRVLT